MKILHIGKYYSPIEGGIETINKIVVDSLHGHSQRIISFNNKKHSQEDDVDDVPVIRASLIKEIGSQPLSWQYYKELKRNLRIFSPDVVHLHCPNPLAAFFLLLNKKRFKLIVHWHSDIIAQKFLYKFFVPVEKILLKKADKIIVTSPNYRDASIPLKPYLDKTTIIPCSIDEEKFQISAEEQVKITEIKNRFLNKPIVFFIGRHVGYKGIKYLLEAERYISNDCVIVIAGGGPLTSELTKNYHSDRIHWIGRVKDDEMKYYYHAADILAFPSITKNEAFGVVLIEAMCCETPVVTFTIPGSGVNWVAKKDETALEVNNSDAKQYALAIDKLLSDRNLRYTLGQNGKRRTHKLFSNHVVSNQYRKLYNEIIFSK